MEAGHGHGGGHAEKSGGGMLAEFGGLFAGTIGCAMQTVTASTDGILRKLLPGSDSGGSGHHDAHDH